MNEKAGYFQWSRFFSGLVSPLNFAKAFVFLIQASIIVLVIMAVVFSGIALQRKLLPPRKPAAPVVIKTQSGAVHNSTDDVKKKFGLINIW